MRIEVSHRRDDGCVIFSHNQPPLSAEKLTRGERMAKRLAVEGNAAARITAGRDRAISVPRAGRGRAQAAGVARPSDRALAQIGIDRPRTARADGAANGVPTGVHRFLSSSKVDAAFPKLKALGVHSGLINTAAGPIHIDVLPSTNPNAGEPLVFFGGISYATERFLPWAALFNRLGGPTLVLVALPGQGRTLAQSIAEAREGDGDRTPADQVKAAIAVLDALGIKKPINVGGLSYGGMIALQAMADHPKRFKNLLLMEPYVPSETRDFDPSWKMSKALMDSPLNPIGRIIYRSTARTKIAETLGQNCPDFLKDKMDRYIDALASMANGADDFRVKETLARIPKRRQKDVHMLMQKGSSAHVITMKALKEIERIKIGSYTAFETPAHDIVTRDPLQSSLWAATVLVPKTASARAKKLVAEFKAAAEKAMAEKAAAAAAAEKDGDAPRAG
jgi:pimeloyl-ACP methyl ester carboxylesterase